MKLQNCIPAFFLAAVASQAEVVVYTNSEVGPGGVGSTFTPSYEISTTNLIYGLTPSASGGDFAATEISGGTAVLTDGVYGTITEPGGAPDRTHLIFGLGGGGSGTGTFVTYSLDITSNPLGYDIGGIGAYGGWNDNGRDQQLYTAAYSLVGSPEFIDLPVVDFNPVVAAGLQSATMTSIYWAGRQFLASGVDEIRFTFSPDVENGYAGYAELAVGGLATVPEPAAAALLFASLFLFGARRTRL